MELSDPDQVAQLYVMQWMHENGLHDALRSLEKQVDRRYDDTQLPEASQLMQLVWRHIEQRLQEQQELEEADDEAAPDPKQQQQRRQRRQHHEEALRLLRAGAGDFAGRVEVGSVPPELHRANVIGVRLVPGRQEVITATGDGWVRCVRFSTGSDATAAPVPAAAAAAAATPPTAGPDAPDGPAAAEVVWASRVGGAALLALALHPHYSCGLPLVAVGGMDGRVTVLHGPTGAVMAAVQPHSKYVVRVAWGGAPPSQELGQQGQQRQQQAGHACTSSSAGAAAGSDDTSTSGAAGAVSGGGSSRCGGQQQRPLPMLVLATASTDETVAVLRLDLDPAVLGAAAAAAGAAAAAAGEVAAPGLAGNCSVDLSCLREEEVAGLGRLTTIKQIPYGAAVADVAFLRDGRTLAVGVRGSNYLRLLDCEEVLRSAAAGVGSCFPTEVLVNMNEAGDDHVSFSARQLLPSPCGTYLLVCTDSPRLLVLRTSDWRPLRTIFGLPLEQFPQPSAAWHRDSNYIYASGGNAQLCVFHLGSGRLLHCCAPHRAALRDMHYDPDRNLLATCGFDKTVKLLAAPAPGPAPV